MAAQEIIGGGAIRPDVGHAPFWEDSKRFNQELHDFVTNNS